MELEQEQRQQSIYAAALLISRFVWAKSIPEYEAVFRKQQDAPTMTGEEMLRTAEALTAMLGG